jgi:predicted nucleic acid-binding protein
MRYLLDTNIASHIIKYPTLFYKLDRAAAAD